MNIFDLNKNRVKKKCVGIFLFVVCMGLVGCAAQNSEKSGSLEEGQNRTNGWMFGPLQPGFHSSN